jgi:uncharacterized zinc-type alcohol dehydrogenase-like protein
MSTVKAYAAYNKSEKLKIFEYESRDIGPDDVSIDISYCGICHSDIHMVDNDWGRSIYPIVPGHEIVGRVGAVGKNVTRYNIGDLVGVGCMVGSCGSCESCGDDLEQFCSSGMTMTYSSEDPRMPSGVTYGGYAKNIIVEQKFVLKVSNTLDEAAVAPLLCAGITTYSPLKHWKVSKGQKIGVIGLGGLGHMGVKFAKAMGAHVVMITTSESKGRDAVLLGADEVLLSSDDNEMQSHIGSFDFLLNTIPVKHDFTIYLSLLKNEKTMVMLGAAPMELHTMGLLFGRKKVAGSLIGGIKETQEMLDFCAEKNILPNVEVVKMNQVNEAYTRVINSDVKYRFVLDLSSI